MCELYYLLASGSRELYKNAIYQTLSYPDEYVLNFRYRTKWIPDGIADDHERLVDADAVVVATSESGWGASEYFPLRKGTVVETEQEDGVLYVYLQLQNEWADYSDMSGDVPNPFHALDDLRSTESDGEGMFLFGGEAAVDFRDQGGWRRIVETLSTHYSFSDVLFYRVARVCDIAAVGRETEADIARINPFTYGYKLDHQTSYVVEIVFDFGQNPPAGARDSLFRLSSTNYVDLFPNTFCPTFRVEKKRVNLNTQEIGSESVEYMSFDIEGDIEGAQMELPVTLGEHDR